MQRFDLYTFGGVEERGGAMYEYELITFCEPFSKESPRLSIASGCYGALRTK